MATREEVFEALNIERKHHKHHKKYTQDTQDQDTPMYLLQEELDLIQAQLNQAQDCVTYNQILAKLRTATGIAIRCFEHYGIQKRKPPLTKKKQLIR